MALRIDGVNHMNNNLTQIKLLSRKKIRISDLVMKCLIWFCAITTAAMVAGIIIYLIVKGSEGISWNFLSTPAFSYPYENYGILGNIINTFYLVVITLLVAAPIGVGAAIYLTEYAKPSRLTRMI